MENGTQESTTTETKQVSLTDEDISQADYERLRNGEKIEVDVTKSETVAQDAIVESEDDDSETSQTDGEDDADSDESEELAAKDDQAEEQKRPAKKGGFKKRIHKLTERLSEREREIEYWKAEALKSKAGQEKEAPKEVAKKDGPPSQDDFETYEDYNDALLEYKVELRYAADKKAREDAELKSKHDHLIKSHRERLNAFRESVDDFDDVIAEVADVRLPLVVEDIILNSKSGPELLYELAKVPDELGRICALPAMDAARAIGFFEAGLKKPSAEKKPTKPKTTKAPPPPKPISASSANVKKSVYDEDLSQAEYERLRAEQERRRV